MSAASEPTSQPIFAAEGYAKRFGEAEVLRAAAVRARPGQVTVLLGRNGSGKSTLLRCALGRLKPETGAVTWRGRPTLRPQIARMARGGLCFVPDVAFAVPGRRVQAHLDALTAVFPEARRLADLDPLEVAPFREARVRELSGGERRRVELTLGLLRNPRCLIADEPLTGLAPVDQQRAVRALRDAARRGAAVLITGHEVDMLMEAADEVVWITAGGTRDMGSPEQAWSHPEFARDYLGRRSRMELRPQSGPEDSEPNRAGVSRPTAPPPAWSSRLRHVWLPLAGAAAGIWVTVRIAMTAFGSAVRALPGAGDEAVSAWAAGTAAPVVGVCVLLAWVDHLRRGADAWLPTLGVGRPAAFITWGATCLALELVAATLLAAL
ncbi:ATP-binding cassette domain-containing protein [Candidatus Palauibacter sp.]|uniref:ATP-binding cassette domain-containing protein n=1 Tax=Candidatus Palauibacter sp. TaxID=3101350 RepID=UPI003D0D1323